MIRDLQELIRTGLKQNYDLRLAAERINSARAQLAVARSRLFPQVAGNGDFNGGKDWTTQTNSNFLTLTADAAFQLDLFGKLRPRDRSFARGTAGNRDASRP